MELCTEQSFLTETSKKEPRRWDLTRESDVQNSMWHWEKGQHVRREVHWCDSAKDQANEVKECPRERRRQRTRVGCHWAQGTAAMIDGQSAGSMLRSWLFDRSKCLINVIVILLLLHGLSLISFIYVCLYFQ